MARDENCPIKRGDTAAMGATIDANDLPAANLEGTFWRWEDIDWTNATQGAKPTRSNRPVITVLVRNVAAAALLPKRLARAQIAGTDGRYMLGRADGYTATTAQWIQGVVDEFLPAAGVPVNDVFHLVVEGPAMCLTDIAALTAIAVGDVLVALTGATSGATTAGRVQLQDLTGATALLGNQIQNALGRALSAKTTTQTNGDILVDVVRRW